MSPELSLDAIEARLAAATPGPWRIEDGSVWATMPNGRTSSVVFCPDCECDDECDIELIAHAPADLAALVAEVKRLRAAEAGVRALHQPNPDIGHATCRSCQFWYPCPTTLALEGEA